MKLAFDVGQPNAWKDNFANAGKNPYVEALNDMMNYFKQQERSAKPRSIENERKERQAAKAARSQLYEGGQTSDPYGIIGHALTRE